MRITMELTDAAILEALGRRIERYRIEAALTQAELAEQAGIGKRTLERVEAGHGAELLTVIRVLRALSIVEGFERLLPELPPSPIEQLERRGKQRQRVTHPRGGREPGDRSRRPPAAAPGKAWTWGVPGPPAATVGRRTRRKS